MPKEPSLGEILGAALHDTSVEHERERRAEEARRKELQKATGRTLQIRTDKVITEVTDLVIPHWIELALQGRKVDAVKELRNTTATTHSGNNSNERMSLLHAKLVVDTLIITRRYENQN